jgi:small subunit ribosomal protein S8
MLTDPIANFITALQNAAHTGKSTVAVPRSRMKESIAQVLQKAGYLADVATKGKSKNILEVTLLFADGAARVHGVKRLSRPSRRMYMGHDDMFPVKNGYGHLIVSTPEGVMTGREAHMKKIGGEALFQIW